MDGYDKHFRKNRSLFTMSLEIHENGNLRMSVTVNVRVYVYMCMKLQHHISSLLRSSGQCSWTETSTDMKQLR